MSFYEQKLQKYVYKFRMWTNIYDKQKQKLKNFQMN